MTEHTERYWDINRNRAAKDFIPTTKPELIVEMEKLEERLTLCKSMYEHLNKKNKNQS